MDEREIGRIHERLENIEDCVNTLNQKINTLYDMNMKRIGIVEAIKTLWTALVPIIASAVGAGLAIILSRRHS